MTEQLEMAPARPSVRELRTYLLEVAGIPCLGFALLRLLVMAFDQGSVYQDAYIPFVVGILGRASFPLLVVVILAARPLDPLLCKRTLLPAAFVACVCSTFYMSGYFPAGSWVLVALRGMAFCGIGWLYVCWGETFRHMRVYDVAVATTLSMIVSSVLAYAIDLLPLAGEVVCAGCIPLVATWLFFYHMRKGYPHDPYRIATVVRGKTDMVGAYGRWFLALALFSVVMGVVYAVSIMNPNEHDAGGLTFVLYTATSIVLALMLLVSVVVREGFFSLNACWALFAVLACVTLGFSVVFDGALQIALAVFAAIRYVALAFVNIKLLDIARHSSMPLYVCFAVAWATVNLFMALGESLTVSFAVYADFSSGTPIVVLIATLLTGSLFIFGGSNFSDVHMGLLEKSRDAEAHAETVADIQYRQCRALSRLHGLTEREAEVVLLVAQGYTQAYCADALMVSLNTVRTHMKRIYAKLDIHTKDELLEMLAQVETDGR